MRIMDSLGGEHLLRQGAYASVGHKCEVDLSKRVAGLKIEIERQKEVVG